MIHPQKNFVKIHGEIDYPEFYSSGNRNEER